LFNVATTVAYEDVFELSVLISDKLVSKSSFVIKLPLKSLSSFLSISFSRLSFAVDKSSLVTKSELIFSKSSILSFVDKPELRSSFVAKSPLIF
jgi:hypothetical protein